MKPLVSLLSHKFACSFVEHDYDEMEEDAKSYVSKLPTVRVWEGDIMRVQFTTNHADMLDVWLKTHVRVNGVDDF